MFAKLTTLHRYIERQSAKKYFAVKLSFILMFASWFFAFPEVFTFFIQHKLQSSWDVVILKANDLTNNLEHLTAYSWQAKKIFRITIPVIIKFFKLNPFIIICLQIGVGFLTYLYSYKLTHRISGDAVQATLIASTLAFLYFGRAAFFEHEYLWFDGFSYFFLLMAMYARRHLFIFIFSAMAAWNDERGFVGLSLVFLFHYFEKMDSDKINIRRVFNIDGRAAAVLLAILFYVSFRFILIYKYGMVTNLSGVGDTQIIENALPFLAIGLLSFFEGFWLLIIFFLGFLIYKRDHYRAIIILIPLLAMVAVAFCVADITRSGAFAVPIIFLIVSYLNKILHKDELKIVAGICFVITFIIPPIFVCSDWGVWAWFQKPTYMYLIDFIKNRTLYG
ncbi:MAG: hypothetical protein ACK5FT_06800 [Sphingomonadales bacterium]|jgi:hypothetical protein